MNECSRERGPKQLMAQVPELCVKDFQYTIFRKEGSVSYSPDAISVATIRFAGQPSCAALRASTPTVMASQNPSYLSRTNMTYSRTQHPTIYLHC